MNSPRVPTALHVIVFLALVLLSAAPGVARAEDIKASIDQAGTAAGRQIGEWLGAPAPGAKAAKPGKPAARPRAAAIPLPPPRPAEAGPSRQAPDEGEEEASTESPEPVVSAAPEPTGKAGAKWVDPGRAPLGLGTRSPAAPSAAPASDTPAEPTLAEAPPSQVAAFPDAPGIPLPPERPDRIAMPSVAQTPMPQPSPPLALPAAGIAMPLPPARPTLTPSEQPAEGEAAAEETAEDGPGDVPLPPERPRVAMLVPPVAAELQAAPAPSLPSSMLCPEVAAADLGIVGPAETTSSSVCRVERPVSLTAIKLRDGRLVPLEPAAVLRCDMAAAVARWVREGVAPAIETLGSPIASVLVASSYECRTRNRVKGAKISEHGQGNAMDTRGYTLENGRRLLIGGTGAEAMPEAFQALLKASACTDFTTILGPGSDGYHELHLHVDRAQRRNNLVLCRWALAKSAPAARTNGQPDAAPGAGIDPSPPASDQGRASEPGSGALP